MSRAAVVVVVLLATRVASADLLNNAAIHAHVDRVVAGPADRTKTWPSLRADRLPLTLGMLVPIFGSSRLDDKVFGGVRPSGVVFDWVLGGIAPLGLAVTALATEGTLSSRTRAILGWSALGLYASTRIAVLVVANLHVSEYNRYLRLRLATATTARGRPAPVVTTTFRW